MHPGSTLNPEKCTAKADRTTRKHLPTTTLKQLDQHQATTSPPSEHHHDEEMHEQKHIPPQQQGETLPSGSGTAAPSHMLAPQGPYGEPTPASQGHHAPTRLSFADPDPPKTTWETIATRNNRANSAPVAPATGTGIPITNIYEPIQEHGTGTNDIDNERLSFGSLSGASRTHSIARNNKVRDLIPLTPEILQLLDRLEPDKGKQARLLTDPLIGQRTLPSTESELQTHLERWAARELKRQQVSAEACAKAAS